MTEGRGKEKKIGLVQLKVDGKLVPLKGFVQDFIGYTIIGMLSSLKAISNPREIEMKIRVKP
jgi:hypothetical protein